MANGTAGRFVGRVAVVTGAASGIGLATAQDFANEGAAVVLIDIDERRGRENVRGCSNTVQVCASVLADSGHGAIVNIASISGHTAQPGRWTYNASKGAILALTRCQALDLSSSDIRVNSVSPGTIWAPEVDRLADGNRGHWEPIWGRYHMLRRCGEPFEVSRAIAFLCSDDASFITATDLRVDGGYLGMGHEGVDSAPSADHT